MKGSYYFRNWSYALLLIGAVGIVGLTLKETPSELALFFVATMIFVLLCVILFALSNITRLLENK